MNEGVWSLWGLTLHIVREVLRAAGMNVPSAYYHGDGLIASVILRGWRMMQKL